MITHVFSIATVTADQLRWTEAPWCRWPCVQIDDVGPKQLARLGAFLGVGTYEKVLADFSFLAGESQESPWVVALPERLGSRLGEIADDEITPVAVDWAEALDREEARPTGELADSLRNLVGFFGENVAPFALYVTLGTTEHHA